MDNIARRDLVSCESCEALLRRQRKGNALHHVPSREFFSFPTRNRQIRLSPFHRATLLSDPFQTSTALFPPPSSPNVTKDRKVLQLVLLCELVCAASARKYLKKIVVFIFFFGKAKWTFTSSGKKRFWFNGGKKNFRHLLRDEWKKRWVRHTTSVEISWREPVVVGIVRPSINLSTRRLRDRPCLTKESNRVCVDRKSACGRRGASRPLAIRQLSLDLPNV